MRNITSKIDGKIPLTHDGNEYTRLDKQKEVAEKDVKLLHGNPAILYIHNCGLTQINRKGPEPKKANAVIIGGQIGNNGDATNYSIFYCYLKE